MLFNQFRFLVFIAVLLFSGNVSFIQANTPTFLNSSNPAVRWETKVYNETDNITQLAYSADSDAWKPATVPGTVFTDYVNLGLEKDPNYGDNIYQVDRDKYNRSFWYRTRFAAPKISKEQSNVWLHFDGINRSGIIYLNGVKLGELRGMMERGKFNITKHLKPRGENVLLVLVSLPNQKRHPEEKFANLASPTYLSSAGWDWMPYVPGLNTGITDNVFLTLTGDITLQDPWMRTKLKDGNKTAELELNTELKNTTRKKLIAKVSGTITPGNIQFEDEIVIGPNELKTITFNSINTPSFRVSNPELWWPNGYGTPTLYTCSISLSINGKVSSATSFNFGIKEYSYKIENNVFHVLINGTKVFLKGGNWGMSEYLLRARGSEYDKKIILHKDLNFNIIRNWMGSTTDKEFYEACDKHGIMIWDDFWLNSKFGVPEYPDDFNNNAVDKIKRFRNHPSIAIWCGENEGTPGKYENGEDLNKNLTKFVALYDGGDRHYQPDSRKGNGLSGSGLWRNYEPSFYFANARNSVYSDSYPEGKGWGLRSEIGTAVFTTFESFKEFIPQEHWWPRNEMWNKHFFGPLAKNGGPDIYEQSINERYGVPENIEEFCERAQFLNIETNKAMFEAWSHHMWDDASGILIWMSQSAYPSFVWQTYDYYYDATGAYWGAKKACEPIHIQWNIHDNSIKCVNTTLNDLKDYTATAVIYNADGQEVKELTKTSKININRNAATSCFTILDINKRDLLTDINFLRLILKDNSGKTITTNDYWFGKKSDYLGLNSIPKAEFAYWIHTKEVKDGKYHLGVRITNNSKSPAFGVRLRLVDKNTNKRILPVIMNDNYLILMPNERREIKFEFDDNEFKNSTPAVLVKQYGYPEEEAY